jgi:hypothetical protein
MGFELEREDEGIVVVSAKRPAGSFEVISDKMGAVAYRTEGGNTPAVPGEEPELAQK